MISKPGIYRDLTATEYHADPAPVPSISQSIAKLLIAKSPLHAWNAHPRLNPDYQPDNHKKFDLGNAAHSILIGRGKDLKIIEADDYRTSAAKLERDNAIARGQSPILGHQYAKANRLALAAKEQLALRGLSNLFDPEVGAGECVLLWHEGMEILARQQLDWLSDDHLIYADYKTTEESAAPHTLGRKMYQDGWQIQAAMCDRGLAILHPGAWDRGTRYLFIVQEVDPPYQLTVAQIDEDALNIGRQQLQFAFDVFGACQRENRWPGYPLEIAHPAIPSWGESEWLNRQIETAAKDRMVTEIV